MALRRDYIIIIGCGRLGSKLANALSDAGMGVLIIDSDKGAARKLSPSYSGIFITGDATDIFVLNEAQIEKATAVIAVTDDDNTNILVAQIARELYHIKQVFARLYDGERECVYREFGIKTICPADLSAKEIYRLLKQNEIEPPAANDAGNAGDAAGIKKDDDITAVIQKIATVNSGQKTFAKGHTVSVKKAKTAAKRGRGDL